MKQYIALLRGINVGGHKKFPKADQLKILTDLGFKNTQVYIHTGNWVFSSEKSSGEITALISESIMNTYGWNVPIVIFSISEFETIVANCPFPKEKKEASYFTLLAEIPAKENIEILHGVSYSEEEFHLEERCLYFYSTISAARVKMNNNFIEKKLQVSATSRNYKTMVKLIELSNIT